MPAATVRAHGRIFSSWRRRPGTELDRGYVIYSLGSDLKDDGGNGTNDMDITFRVGR